MLGLRGRRPGAHARAGAGPRQVDRGIAAEIVAMADRRHVLLVRAPAEFGGLQALRAEAFDRPRVDEHAARLRVAGALGVALGDVDTLDAEPLHQAAPVLAALGLLDGDAGVAGDVEQRLLDHPGHHAGVRPAAADRGHPAGPAAAHVEHALAQRIVRALRDRGLGVGVEARPRFADRVDVVGIDVLAEVHQIGRGGVDRQVDDHAAAGPAGEQRGEDLPVILPGDRNLLEAQAALVEQDPIGVDRVDDDELGAIEADVPLKQRQHAAADGAEADHDDRAGEFGVQDVALRSYWSTRSCRLLPSSETEVHAARDARLSSLPAKPAMSAARSGFGSSAPVALTSPVRLEGRPARTRGQAAGDARRVPAATARRSSPPRSRSARSMARRRPAARPRGRADRRRAANGASAPHRYRGSDDRTRPRSARAAGQGDSARR